MHLSRPRLYPRYRGAQQTVVTDEHGQKRQAGVPGWPGARPRCPDCHPPPTQVPDEMPPVCQLHRDADRPRQLRLRDRSFLPPQSCTPQGPRLLYSVSCHHYLQDADAGAQGTGPGSGADGEEELGCKAWMLAVPPAPGPPSTSGPPSARSAPWTRFPSGGFQPQRAFAHKMAKRPPRSGGSSPGLGPPWLGDLGPVSELL